MRSLDNYKVVLMPYWLFIKSEILEGEFTFPNKPYNVNLDLLK